MAGGSVADLTNLSGTFQFDDEAGLLEVAEQIRRLGHQPLLVDVGSGDMPQVTPDITREEVACAGDVDLDELRTRGDRGECVSAMAFASPRLLERLYRERRIDGVISLGGSGGRSSSSARPRWSRAGSAVSYTRAQVQSLTPVRNAVETKAAEQPELRDVFLCHAWDDRQGAAKQLHDLLEAAGVKVWFSEKDLGLGVPMMRAIDKGLAASRIGLVLVTPALLARLPKESVADKELSALLAGNRLVPIVHNTTYGALRNVSPLLASRTGLDTAEDTMAVVATKIAELVSVEA